jgi:hypothetical protein
MLCPSIMLKHFKIRSFVPEAANAATSLPCRQTLVASHWYGDVPALAERRMR